MDIAEVVKASGLSASTLRYYEQQGLIKSSSRKGLRRQFNSKVVEQLAFISLASQAGFSLLEIKPMLTSTGAQVDRAKLNAKADELDKTIKALTTMRDGLRHSAKCKAANHFECPTFRRLLNIASKKPSKPNNKLKQA
ncbi:MerR family transcriptional regulator [Agarivorans sp. B2Z047]|uniref:helix-turn-helix domain-containing protein n=1 Tax=Agarivorans sp. B2Z047 TaxID=2652721 RepID=UPI00128C42FE|nr:helix-turn-helix domain-containing protein [Agarivorans sp. B2Z047]MPW29368.1 MerR family transcriptional regulator [Agarivorans sp. B2Z047]UQN44956.1 helix-turn-helix domain-containing protein [Agarivorans sp. B2Z047]